MSHWCLVITFVMRDAAGSAAAAQPWRDLLRASILVIILFCNFSIRKLTSPRLKVAGSAVLAWLFRCVVVQIGTQAFELRSAAGEAHEGQHLRSDTPSLSSTDDSCVLRCCCRPTTVGQFGAQLARSTLPSRGSRARLQDRMNQPGVSFALGDLGLPNPSGKLGSMHMVCKLTLPCAQNLFHVPRVHGISQTLLDINLAANQFMLTGAHRDGVTLLNASATESTCDCNWTLELAQSMHAHAGTSAIVL